MKGILIPVSFMEEEKEFLGMMSIRQVLITGPTILMIYLFVTSFPVSFLSWKSTIIFKFLGTVIMASAGYLLAFYYLDKHEMFLDKFLKIRWRFSRSHKLYYYNRLIS